MQTSYDFGNNLRIYLFSGNFSNKKLFQQKVISTKSLLSKNYEKNERPNENFQKCQDLQSITNKLQKKHISDSNSR